MVLRCVLQLQPHNILDQHKDHARYCMLNLCLEVHTDKNDKLSCWYCYLHLQLHLQIYILCTSSFPLCEIEMSVEKSTCDAYISKLIPTFTSETGVETRLFVYDWPNIFTVGACPLLIAGRFVIGSNDAGGCQ